MIIKLISLYKEIGGENILLVSAVNSSIVIFEAAVKAFCIRDERNFAFISEKIAEEKKEKGKKRKKDKDISDIDTLPF